MRVTGLVVCFIILMSKTYGQDKMGNALPEAFTKNMSTALTYPTSSGIDSIDMYTVAVILNPDGQIVKVFYSEGMPNIFKELLRHRLSIAEIDSETLEEYWKKFCKTNSINVPTCILQTVSVRLEGTDKLKFSASQMEERFQRAMTFRESPFLFEKNLSFIWLNPITKRFPRERIVQ